MKAHYYHRTVKQRIAQQGLLHSVMFELTYRCNLDCFFCYNDKEASGQPLSLQQYLQVLDELQQMQVLFVTFSGGEPLVHPDFFAIAAAANKLGFAIRVKSGGHSLRGKVARRLKDEVNPFMVEISLHGATAETHDRQTRVAGSFDRLMVNLQEMRDVGLRPSFVTTLTAWNEGELEQMFELADRLGIHLRFQGPVGPRDNGDQAPLAIQPSKGGWDRLAALQASRPQAAGRVELNVADTPAPRDHDAHCGVGTEEILVDPFGNVVPCLHLRWQAGSLHERSIRDIWEQSVVFPRARQLSRDTRTRMQREGELRLFESPLFCPGLEKKGCTVTCGGCGS